jgi:flagellar biosynthesis/type III secretory pathway protein FliH
MSNLTPLEQLIKYIRKRYETNTSFENLVEALKEEDETILETEKEQAYNQGHNDGYNEALEANDNPFNK